jgi:enterochelin esterase-like enzyme
MPSPFLPPAARRGAVRALQIEATRLRDNPRGDPALREVLVWTPPGWSPDDAPLPAILVLPGFAGLHDDAAHRGLSEPSLTDRFAAMVADGRCAPFLAVFPDVMTSLGGSQLLDSAGFGRWQSYLLDDVVCSVEAAFNVSHWGATGRSSGAYGAFQLALRAPERVVGVALHAPDCGFDLCYLGDIPGALRAIQAAGGPDAFVAGVWSRPRLDADAFSALNLIAMSVAYALDVGPLADLLPFDPATGEVRFEVVQGWQRLDPITQAADPAHRASLASLRHLSLDVGQRDEYMLHLGCRRLRDRLAQGGVEVRYEEFDGGHRGTAWRYEVSLPPLVAALATP